MSKAKEKIEVIQKEIEQAKQKKDVKSLKASLTNLGKAAEEAAGELDATAVGGVVGTPDEFADFRAYTSQVINHFIDQSRQIQNQRESLVSKLDSLQKAAAALLVGVTPAKTLRIGHFKVLDDKIRDIKVIVEKRELSFDKGNFTVTEDKSKTTTSRIRIRLFRTIIPEFSTGAYFTNLNYPRYGTGVNSDGETVVAAAKTERYPVVAAGMLNLVFNSWEGQVHPLLQVGVGTGKDLPSLLAGGGLRFLDPALALTGGVLWTWRRELNTLNVGDVIEGTAALENDLVYYLDPKPRMYLGIQYNF